jgi:hypothetical protein
MKRIVLLLLATTICSGAATFAQDKKTVAVYVTGNCSGTIKEMVSSRVIAQIVRSREYAAVERTAEFDRALVQEATYQRSGNVDDGQVIRLGRQFGASLVCVADASEKQNVYYSNYQPYEYLFTVRLINIETGLVMSSSMEVKNCDSGNHYDADKKDCYHGGRSCSCYMIRDNVVVDITDRIVVELLQNVTTAAGKRNLAVYVTESSGVFEGKTVSSRLVQNFTNSGVYAAVDRTSDFQVELKRQYSGKVGDSQITKLGQQFGVSLVCVARVLSNGYTYARMVNVETGIILATAEASDWHIESVDAIASELLSQTVVKKEEKTTSTAWAVEPVFDDVMSFSEGMAAVKQNDKWGFIDRTGKTVIQTQFSSVGDFREGLAAVEQNGKWGYIDKTGKWIIQSHFAVAVGFSEGLALIGKDGKWGIIDKTGKVVFWLKKDIEEFGLYFSEGLLAASVSQKSMLPKSIRKLNELLAWGNARYDDEDDLHKKYMEFTGEEVERWGFLNRNGEWVIEPQFYSVSPLGFGEGLIIATKSLPYKVAGKISGNNYYTYAINKNGNVVCSVYYDGFGRDLARYNHTGQFSEGLIAVREEDEEDEQNGKCGYKDRTGQWIIQPQFDDAKAFDGGLALAKQLDNWGYIDKTGQWAIQPQFSDEIMGFSEGLAGAKHDDKWGFIDKTGKWVFPPAFDDIRSFSEGMATVKQNGKVGFIALPDR